MDGRNAWEPKIIAFFCNGGTYGAADLAGVSRMEHPPNFRVIRLPCSGRVSPKFILAAFREGADGVWVSGCHPGDCHYEDGSEPMDPKMNRPSQAREKAIDKINGPKSL